MNKAESICDSAVTSAVSKGSIDMLTSPNYPQVYPKNSDCWVTKTVEKGEVIEIMFITPIAIEGCCDYLEVCRGGNRWL